MVRLPLKCSRELLGNSKETALKRFLSMEQKLNVDTELKQQYVEFMNEYIQLKHMTKLNESINNDNSISYYIPHHFVKKENSLTTKLRVVYDASSKSTTGYSLNDIQMIGPKLQQDLISIILRFRSHKYILAGDITKMYRQILIDPDDRKLQRILWRSNPCHPLGTYVLNTVTYGTSSAPFLAVRCLHEVAYQNKSLYPAASKVILNDFYVDDLLTGTSNSDHLISLYKEISIILNSAGFSLNKWISNDPIILTHIQNAQENAIINIGNENETYSLGLLWYSNSDTLKYQTQIDKFPKAITKRNVLSTVASIYDPLGLIGPIIIKGKILLQKLWQEKITWDESLPANLSNEWKILCNQLHLLNDIQVPRFALCQNPVNVELHGFCDFSEQAYGACVYVRSVNNTGEVQANLLVAKSKVAPLKNVTIPRLELCACVLLSRLIEKIAQSWQAKFNKIYLWNDSTIALSWIQAEPTRWKVFVANRVSEIQNLTNKYDWRHINTHENPADVISRGLEPVELKNCPLWWKGPEWLLQPTNTWPVHKNKSNSVKSENIETMDLTSSDDQAPPKKKPKTKSKEKTLMQIDAEKIVPITSIQKPPKKRLFRNEDASITENSSEQNVTTDDAEQKQLVENFLPKVKMQHKLENYVANDLAEIVIDEISLEGLDGITIEALWTRISNKILDPLPFSTDFENAIWDIAVKTTKLKFYLLEEPRHKLVIFNRYKCVDWDTGHITEPEELPEDVYPFSPISEQDNENTFGSCASFKTRLDITHEVRPLSLSQVQERYGSKLVLVTDQTLRNKALGLDCVKSLTKLANVHYCILERIGRSRKLGEVTAGKQSLLQMCDSKNLFYFRKVLLANDLITKQQFCMRNPKSGSTSALLFHLRRFYNEYKSMKMIVMEQIVDIMKKKPDHRIEYLELKKIVGSDLWRKGVQKLIKSVEFKQYVQTDLLVPYRTMYPNASPAEWSVKSGVKEKNLRVLELVNAPVKLSTSSKEEEFKEDSSDEEPLGEYAINFSAFSQAYSTVYESGSEGLSLKQVQRKLGLDFYITRSILTNMTKRNLMETRNVDFGRLHVLKYYVHPSNALNVSSISENPNDRPSTSTQQNDADDEALSFIAGVLQVDKDKLTAKREENHVKQEFVISNPFQGHFDFIKEYRTKNRLEKFNKQDKLRFKDAVTNDANDNEKRIKAQEREKYESIFKNEHSYYPMKLSMKHKRIELLELNIQMGDDFVDVFKPMADCKIFDKEPSMDCDNFNETAGGNLDSLALEKIRAPMKLPNLKILLGSSEKALAIMKVYMFVPINTNFANLLKRHRSIMADLKTKNELENLEFPGDLLSDDDENYSSSETKDDKSMIVNLEELEQPNEEFNEEDLDVKTFKACLIKHFQSTNHLFEQQTGDLLVITGDDTEKARKRKSVDVPEETPKQIKLISESEKNLEDHQVNFPENKESVFKRVTDSIKMDIYMGKNPILLSHYLDDDNIETTIITTETTKVQPPVDQKYTNKTLSQRSVARANFILETVYREKFISDIPKLSNTIKALESEKRLIGMVDRKSVDRLLNHLVIAGYIKIFKVVLKYENVTRCKNIICSALVDAANTIQVFIDQMKIGFFIYAKRKTDLAKPSTSGANSDTAGSFKVYDSYEEIVALIANQKRPQYKYSRVIARQYGYVPKFAKIKIMHELLFYLVYSYDGEAVNPKEVPNLLKQFHVKLDDKAIKELGTIYKRELSWKMFIPPLLQYKGWPTGWALICDVILRLPLSLFVKIFNIAYVIPELLPLLNDPVKKHVLLKNVPADIRNACLHNRRCIFSIHEILCHLCYIGLLQFGVQKLKEKEQQFVYLNRRAILYDTTSSELGYHEISKKEYPVLQFYFENQTIVDNYWSKMWSISMNTKLGQRYSLLQKTITLQDIHAKPEMIQSVTPKTPDVALEVDVGYIPGDKLGGCCFDSSTWVHVKRNWIWSNSIRKGKKQEVPPGAPIVGIRKKHLEQVKVKSIKYKDLQKELTKKKLKKPSVQGGCKTETKSVVKRNKKTPVIRKVLPRPPPKKMKVLKQDELDKRIMNKMGRSRAIWSEEEDVMILICHSAKRFLSSNSRKKAISPIIIRDIMHRLCPNKRRKVTLAYTRRRVKLLKSSEYQGNERHMYHLESDKYLQKVFSKFKSKIADGETIPDEHLHMAFIYLVVYIVSSCKNKFKTQQKIFEGDEPFDYLTPEDVPKYVKRQDMEDTDTLYQNPRSVDEIKVNVIKDIVHCSLDWKSDSSDLPLMLYRAYQHYPDHLLKEAISWLRKHQIIAGKKMQTKHWNVKEGIQAGNLIHNSFFYCFKQITKYPDYIYPEAYQMFVSVYKRNDVEREFLVEKFEQGHGLGLSEIACWHDVMFSFKIPDDLMVLDPKINDHSQLIQELAVRYKFLINQKKNSQENDQEKDTKDIPENLEGIEKAIEVIFEAQKQKSLTHESNASDKLAQLEQTDEIQLTYRDSSTASKEPRQEKVKQEVIFEAQKQKSLTHESNASDKLAQLEQTDEIQLTYRDSSTASKEPRQEKVKQEVIFEAQKQKSLTHESNASDKLAQLEQTDEIQLTYRDSSTASKEPRQEKVKQEVIFEAQKQKSLTHESNASDKLAQLEQTDEIQLTYRDSSTASKEPRQEKVKQEVIFEAQKQKSLTHESNASDKLAQLEQTDEIQLTYRDSSTASKEPRQEKVKQEVIFEAQKQKSLTHESNASDKLAQLEQTDEIQLTYRDSSTASKEPRQEKVKQEVIFEAQKQKSLTHESNASDKLAQLEQTDEIQLTYRDSSTASKEPRQEKVKQEVIFEAQKQKSLTHESNASDKLAQLEQTDEIQLTYRDSSTASKEPRQEKVKQEVIFEAQKQKSLTHESNASDKLAQLEQTDEIQLTYRDSSTASKEPRQEKVKQEVIFVAQKQKSLTHESNASDKLAQLEQTDEIQLTYRDSLTASKEPRQEKVKREVIFEAQKQKSLTHESNASDKLAQLEQTDEIQLTYRDSSTASKEPRQEKVKQEKEVKSETSEESSKKCSEILTDADKTDDTTKALHDLTTYLGNKQDESTLRVSDLAYLLTKGLFPELDDDEERLEKLNRHFLITYPSSMFYVPQMVMGEVWAEELLSKAQTKGDEIQEMIRGECIVKNTSHDEEISNSLIDIGGDDEDIKLASSIVNYVKHKGVHGATGPEIKSEFLQVTHNLSLREIIMVLIKVGIVFRAGVQSIKFIHVTENETWTVGLDDERPISELNLNSLGVRLKLMPWVRINGTLNVKVLHNWMNVILSHCLSHPFVMLSSLMKRFNFLKPVDIFSLLEYLRALDSIRLYTYVEAKPITLLSTVENLEKKPANILDGFETIFVEVDKTATIKMGAFHYKGQTDIDIPFEE